ncbi:hypothetical protein PVK06_008592 [Gossypium arboreum]|uniref:Uncharacterized protein n=1 Tax=Gossypium arboreum TaxID=29729 RepID=A0ABR0QKD0_GOSAR|nr:hypothetical protein PVK06_008592 [Gossypium arboreum]
MSLNLTMDNVNELFDSYKDKLSDKNDALEAMMMALKEETMATTLALSTRIKELEGELALCRAAIENFFCAKGIMDDTSKVNTASLFLIDIALLWWRGRTTDKRQGEIGTWQEFQCELKGQFYPEFAEEEA